MIPVLYEHNETVFDTNGLGGLPDALSCLVIESLNVPCGYYLEMSYQVNGLHYNDLGIERFVYAVPAPNKKPQPFRISRIEKSINGVAIIEAPHLSADMAKMVSYGIDTGTNIQGMCFNQLYRARQLGQDVPFWLTTDKTVPSSVTFNHPEPTSLMDIWLGKEGSVLDVVGGEYEWDNYQIILHNNRGKETGYEIRYGYNMSEMSAELDTGDLVTGVVPFWKGEDSNGNEVVVMGSLCSADTAGNYAYNRVVPYNATEDFDLEQGVVPSQTQVTNAGQSFINGSSVKDLEMSIEVQFVETAPMTLYLGDTVTVVYPALGIKQKAKVVKTVFNVLTERYESITIGTLRKNAADTLAGLLKKG